MADNRLQRGVCVEADGPAIVVSREDLSKIFTLSPKVIYCEFSLRDHSSPYVIPIGRLGIERIFETLAARSRQNNSTVRLLVKISQDGCLKLPETRIHYVLHHSFTCHILKKNLPRDDSMKILIIIATAVTMLVATKPLNAANVLQDNQKTHNDCCEKSWVDAQTGMQYVERWLCFLTKVQCISECTVACPCGLSYKCGETTDDIVLCLKIPGQGPQCFPDAMYQDRADIASFMRFDRSTVARAHGCDCVDACDLFDCNEFSVIDDCYFICNGNLDPD